MTDFYKILPEQLLIFIFLQEDQKVTRDHGALRDMPVSHRFKFPIQNDELHKYCLLFPSEEPLSDNKALILKCKTVKFCKTLPGNKCLNICAVSALQ